MLEGKADKAQRLYAAKQQLLRHVLLGLKELHSRGRAHCDIKSGNVRVVVGVGACIIRCTFVDMGGSVVFAGQRRDAPQSFDTTPTYASPEVVCLQPDVHLDTIAHDLWSVGCLMATVLTGEEPFSPANLPQDIMPRFQALHQEHMRWAECCSSPDSIASQGHHILRRVFASCPTSEQYSQASTLLQQLLALDGSCRISAQEGLDTHFFAPSADSSS